MIWKRLRWKQRPGSNESGGPESALRAAVAQVISEFRPYVAADGGDIELVGVDADGTVRVRLGGACAGCPASFLTLQIGLEQRLRERIPQVRTVVNVP